MSIRTLQPERLWKEFYEICQIPHPSKKEEKMIAYLQEFGKRHNLETRTDAAGNVLICKPATPGYENRKKVILQSHMDMVCEKNNDTQHNFDTDPIQPYIDGEWVKAKGTTLGADNGIGMAGALAVLLDNTLEHGKVECLFTINEEIGLEGAQNLGKDMITGSMLINLDSEDDGEIFVGCAGGIDTTAYFNYTPVAAPEDLCYVKVAISGLLGGHSGSDINTGRGNANKLIARFVWNISKDINLKLASFDGGNLRNAIPREAHAILGVAADKKAEIEARLAEYTKEIENEYKGIEPVVKFTLEAVERPAFIVDDATAKALILSLYSAPHGVYSMSRDLEGLVETSTNLAAVKFIDGNKIKVTTSQRSSVESRKHDIAAQVETHFLLAGAEIDHSDGYPGWAPNMDSTIMRVCSEAYEELYNVKPAIKAIHAGLECGLFLAKYPHLDMVSVGPTMTGVHSPDEKLYIPHVEKFWHHLALTLKKVAKL